MNNSYAFKKNVKISAAVKLQCNLAHFFMIDNISLNIARSVAVKLIIYMCMINLF